MHPLMNLLTDIRGNNQQNNGLLKSAARRLAAENNFEIFRSISCDTEEQLENIIKIINFLPDKNKAACALMIAGIIKSPAMFEKFQQNLSPLDNVLPNYLLGGYLAGLNKDLSAANKYLTALRIESDATLIETYKEKLGLGKDDNIKEKLHALETEINIIKNKIDKNQIPNQTEYLALKDVIGIQAQASRLELQALNEAIDFITNFHKEMAIIVQHCFEKNGRLKTSLFENKPKLAHQQSLLELENLLSPFKALAENPLAKLPTDKRQQILAVCEHATAKSEESKKVHEAIAQCLANTTALNSLLLKLSKEEGLPIKPIRAENDGKTIKYALASFTSKITHYSGRYESLLNSLAQHIDRTDKTLTAEVDGAKAYIIHKNGILNPAPAKKIREAQYASAPQVAASETTYAAMPKENSEPAAAEYASFTPPAKQDEEYKTLKLNPAKSEYTNVGLTNAQQASGEGYRKVPESEDYGALQMAKDGPGIIPSTVSIPAGDSKQATAASAQVPFSAGYQSADAAQATSASSATTAPQVQRRPEEQYAAVRAAEAQVNNTQNTTTTYDSVPADGATSSEDPQRPTVVPPGIAIPAPLENFSTQGLTEEDKEKLKSIENQIQEGLEDDWVEENTEAFEPLPRAALDATGQPTADDTSPTAPPAKTTSAASYSPFIAEPSAAYGAIPVRVAPASNNDYVAPKPLAPGATNEGCLPPPPPSITNQYSSTPAAKNPAGEYGEAPNYKKVPDSTACITKIMKTAQPTPVIDSLNNTNKPTTGAKKSGYDLIPTRDALIAQQEIAKRQKICALFKSLNQTLTHMEKNVACKLDSTNPNQQILLNQGKAFSEDLEKYSNLIKPGFGI